MNAASPPSWRSLFSETAPTAARRDVRVIQKGGHDFLVLPQSGNLAAKTLSLYPAQTPRARFAKRLLKTALRLGLPLPFQRVRLDISPEDEFLRFLSGLPDGRAGEVPDFGILAGNPRAEGQRFLVLLFDERGQSAFFVKAGTSAAARKLVEAESRFLKNVGAKFSGLPKFCGSLVCERVEAFAEKYVEGESPTGENRLMLGKMFGEWLDPNRKVSFLDVPAWQALEKAQPTDPWFPKIRERLNDFSFHPTLFHGDFVPWNIKVCRKDGSWTVLDWERGEPVGFPAWDWFHYLIQTGILVEKLAPTELLRRLEKLWTDAAFQKYAESAGVHGKAKVLAVAYLSHLAHVIRPSEGMETSKELLNLLCESGEF